MILTAQIRSKLAEAVALLDLRITTRRRYQTGTATEMHLYSSDRAYLADVLGMVGAVDRWTVSDALAIAGDYVDLGDLAEMVTH